jgi:protein-disulfide isomerase
MKESWKFAVMGGCAGAAFSLAVTFGAAALGISPFTADDGRAVHAYLISHPDVLVEMTNKLQAQQDAEQDNSRQSAVKKLGLEAFFDSRVAFVTGPSDATTTIVEFFDYNCPYCRASVPAVKKFYESHRQARFSFIEFPIKGPSSTVAARAAMAARQQPDKYVAFHFALMSEPGAVDENAVFAVAQRTGLDVERLKKDMASPAVDRALTAAHKLADAADIDGTPAFIIDGKMHEGAVDDEILAKLTRA